jgi:hypothetical protein
VHRQFKGKAEVKEGSASAALILFAMLNQIITQDKLTGDTSITAKLVMRPNAAGQGREAYPAPACSPIQSGGEK